MASLPNQATPRTCYIDFELMLLAEDAYSIILGLPTLAAFGIAISGLPSAYPLGATTPVSATLPTTRYPTITNDKDSTPHISLDDCSRFLDTNKIGSSTYNTYLLDYSQKLLTSLGPALDVNQKITGFCTIPSSVIRFDTGTSIPSNRRQYRLAKNVEPIVDEQLNKWLKAGIVAPSKSNSPWNSALLVAPKKDIAGIQVGWRVCIDPRHINLLIPDANFPMPLIRDILE
jgi:hypothetical protein